MESVISPFTLPNKGVKPLRPNLVRKMEFCIPWQNWNIEDVQYGISQTNTRIENGLFIPIYFADKNVKCQAFHLLSPELIRQDIETTKEGIYIIVKIPKNNDFAKKLKEFDDRNLETASKYQSEWWAKSASQIVYKTALKNLPTGEVEWRLQIPDSGIFSCYDTSRKSWYASNESGLEKRKWKILARTSGLWVNETSFGMDWKLIGAFVV
jgi:hypothetical protein